MDVIFLSFMFRFSCDNDKTEEISQLMKGLQTIFILAYPNVKQWAISNITVNCSQFGQKVFEFFLSCPLQIVPEKIEGIVDFIILVMWL